MSLLHIPRLEIGDTVPNVPLENLDGSPLMLHDVLASNTIVAAFSMS